MGIVSSIQDLGRQGYRKYGISEAGAMDLQALRRLHALLNNPPTAPALEFTFPAPEICFEEETVFAVNGADFEPILEHTPLENGKCYLAHPGEILRFRCKKQGMWCYFAAKGEMDLQPWLGSYARDPYLQYPPLPSEIALTPTSAAPKIRLVPAPATPRKIPVVPGPYYSSAEQNSFTVDQNANRMGYRLKGPALPTYEEQVSAPVQRGNVQLLPEGQLIVLMADAQTMGGYPLWGYVPSWGTDTLAQLSPGEAFHWHPITWEEAEETASNLETHLLQLEIACQLAWKSIVT